MARGRPPKIKTMQQQTDNTKLPHADEGDVIGLKLQITRVSNGYIIKGWKAGDVEEIMVYNGDNGHRAVAAHVLNLALPDMKYGEIIDYKSTITYTKKIADNGSKH